MHPFVDIHRHQRFRQSDRLVGPSSEAESMAAIRLPQRLPGRWHDGLIEQRLKLAERDQGVAAQGGVRLAVSGERVLELAQHLKADRQTPITAKPRPQRRASPIAGGKETQQQIAFEDGSEKAMFGIVQGDESAIGLVPQAGIRVGVKHLDFFAGLFQRIGATAIGPAAQEASAGPRAVPLSAGAEGVIEGAAHQRMRVDDRIWWDRRLAGLLLWWDRRLAGRPSDALQQAQINQLLDLLLQPARGPLAPTADTFAATSHASRCEPAHWPGIRASASRSADRERPWPGR